MKRLVLSLLYWSGVLSLLRLRHKRRLVIVLYHGVAPHEPGGIFNYRKKFVLPESFRSQIEYLQRKYTILELDDAVAKLQAGNLPLYPMVITFDDGYRNVHEHAFPILKHYGVPATVFLATDFVVRNKPLWVDRLEYAIGFSGTESKEEKIRLDMRLREELKRVPDAQKLERVNHLEAERNAALVSDARYAPLTKEMVTEMRASKITFGAHTKSHPILAQLPRERMREEIEGSKREVQELCGEVSNVFAYPNGQRDDFNAEVIGAVGNAGFVAALTTLAGENTLQTPRFEMKRYTLDNTDNWLQFMVGLSGIKQWIQR